MALAAQTYTALIDVHVYSNQALPALYAGIRGLNLAEQADDSSAELAWGYAMLMYLAGINRLHVLAEHYARLAVAHTPPNNSGVAARVSQAVGAYAIGIAQWSRAEAVSQGAIDLSRRVDDWRSWGVSSAGLIGIALFRGQFARALRLSTELAEVAQQSNDVQQRVWGMDGQAESLLRLGRTTQALAVLQRSTVLLTNSTDQIEKASHFGIYALAALRDQHWESAYRYADQTLNLLSQLPTVWSVIIPVSAIAEVYLSLWEFGPDQTGFDPQDCREQVSKVFHILHNYARRFPAVQPRAAWYDRWYHWLTQHPVRAFESCRQCLTRARQLDMPYEQGYAYFEMGRHLPARQRCLTQACAFFAPLDMVYELQRAQAEMGST
jgi:tetratricopeptide (TPR) repeat protein